MTQLYTYIYIHFHIISITFYHRILNIVSHAIQYDLFVYPSYIY